MRETTSKLKAIVSMLMLLAVFAFGAVFMTACNSECQHENLQKHDANAATCSAEGNSEYWACPDCDKIFADEGAQEELSVVPTIAALGHEWEEAWQNDENGHWHKCKNCDTLSSSDPHTVVAIGEAKSPTCTEAGVTAGEKCSVCGYVIEEQTAIAAPGHNLDHVEAKTATCSAAGNIEYWYCEACNNYFRDSNATQNCTQADTVIAIDPDAHTFRELQSAKEATCTEAGNVEYKDCELCGKHFNSDGTELEEVTIAALGHNYNAITIATQPEKLVYIAGEDFSAKGMVVQATCVRDGCSTTTTISDYTLVGAEALTKGAQTVTVKWTFGETELSANVSVSVYDEHDYSSQGSYADFEYMADQALTATMKGGLSGTAFALSCNGEEYNEGVTVSGTSLTLSSTVVSGLLGEKTYGDFAVALYADTYDMYVMNISIVTKVITTAEELKTLSSFGNPITNANGIKVYSGYFVLGNDIYLASGDTFTLHYDNNDTAGATGVTGLNGVFDGRGHMIYGGTYGRGGLLGGVSSGSVVRNVSFIDANVTGSGAAAVICEQFGGTMSDILIDAYLQNGSSVFYITSGEVSMTNVVVYASQAAGADRAAIAEWIGSNSVLNLENVYLFSDMTKLYGLTQGTVTGAPTQYAYDAKLSDDNVSVTGLDGWNLTMDKAWLGDKPQIIQDMLENALSDCEVTALTGKTFTLSLEDITVTTNLADNTQSDYITVDGLTISVSDMLQSSTSFQYIVTWDWNTSVSKTITVTVTKILSIEALETEGLYEQYSGIADTTPTANTADLTIDLASAIDDGSVSLSGASFALIDNTGAQTALSDVSVSGQSITIPRSKLEDLLGEYTLVITVPDMAIYTLPVTVATKLISTTEDLQNMPYYGGLTDKNSQAAYDGYFVMTQNVNMDETKFSNASWMNAPSSVGFQGTFDGRGYSVIGGTYERGGIFLTVGQNGVVKNVAFVGGTVKGGWSHYPVLAQNFYGELNNVFIGNVENTGSSLGALIGSNVDAKLTNVVIYANKGSQEWGSAVAVNLVATTSAENVYVFSDILNSDGSVKIANQGATTGLEGLQAYTFDQIGTEDVSVSGLTTYWDTTTFDIPVFDSSVEYLQGTGFLGYTASVEA